MSKDFFNAKAATWDEKAAEKDISRLEAMAARLEIKPGAAVLDVGSGTGVFVPYILEKIGNKGSLVCLDFAEEMLKIAQSKGYEGNITYVCADILNTRLPDKSFDAVVCYSVFPHFKDKPRALKEIFRLLKPVGRVFICHTSSREYINNVHRNIPEVCDHILPGSADIRRMLADAGFTGIAIAEGENDYLAQACKRA
jgi:ubiquinone/menaquinone biosynthesis C-methylase UbiE